MVISTVNQVVYNGDGVTVAWPYTFRIIDATDIKLTIIDADGTETPVSSDYYVDTVNNTVYYPGYAPGAEPPAEDQPEPVQSGQKLLIYRQLPITQEKDLGDKWPFNVIELGLDKLTMILQQIAGWWDRCLKISPAAEAEHPDFDMTFPIEAGKSFRVNAEGTGFEVSDDPGIYAPIAIAAANTATAAAEAAAAAAASVELQAVWYDNVASLRSANIPAGITAGTKGYYSVNDGGGAIYAVRAAEGGDVDDAGCTVILDNGNVAEMIIGTDINVLSIGLKRDDAAFDNGAYLQSFLDKHDNTLPTLHFPKGVFTFLTGVTLNYQVNFVGEYYQKSESGGPGTESYTSTLKFEPSNAALFTIAAIPAKRCAFSNLYFKANNYMITTTDSEITNNGDGTITITHEGETPVIVPLPYNRFDYHNVQPGSIAINGIYLKDISDGATQSDAVTVKDCAFRGFDTALDVYRLLSCSNSTFIGCNICVQMGGWSHYFFNCSFTSSNYGIVTEAYSINCYGCWFDMMGGYGICSRPDGTGAIVGYIDGVFDYINKSGICAYTAKIGLNINAKFGRMGLYYLYKDPADDFVPETTVDEKFVAYSGASAISLRNIDGAVINAASVPIRVVDRGHGPEMATPTYFLNCVTCRQAVINFSGETNSNAEYGGGKTNPVTPLYHSGDFNGRNVPTRANRVVFNGYRGSNRFVFVASSDPTHQITILVRVDAGGPDLNEIDFRMQGYIPAGTNGSTLLIGALDHTDDPGYYRNRGLTYQKVFLQDSVGSLVGFLTFEDAGATAVNVNLKYLTTIISDTYVYGRIG